MDATPAKKGIGKAAKPTPAKAAVTAGYQAGQNEKAILVELKAIKFHPEIRRRSSVPDVDELVPSLALSGLDSPLGIYKEAENHYLVFGERRLTAIKRLLRDKPERFAKHFKDGIPCTIVATTLDAALMKHVVENAQRVDPNDVDIAAEIHDLHERGQKTGQISTVIGKSSTYVRDHERFHVESSDELKKSVLSGKVSFTDALVVMKQPLDEQGKTAKDMAKAADLPKEEAKEAKKDIKKKVKGKTGQKDSARPSLTDIRHNSAGFHEKAMKDYEIKAYTKGHLLLACERTLQFAAGDIAIEQLIPLFKAGALVKEYEEERERYDKVASGSADA